MNYSSCINYFKNLNCKILENELMSRHTSFKIGGTADLFIEVYNLESLQKILNFLNKQNIKYFLIGNGTNLLVHDSGYRGVILSLKNNFEIININENILECGAGAKLSSACKFALENSLSGLEFAYGIPGSCGGAVFMNAGAYGGEIKDIVSKITCIDKSGCLYNFSNKKCQFSYRNSIFKQENFIITNIFFKLIKENPEKIKSKMNDLILKRKKKQPLEFPSAGSFFKRPEKGYASAIIEQCGLMGLQIGGAAVSKKHAGFIINLGGATYNDVKKLQLEITSQVFKKTNIKLEPEIIEI
ncbi:MAG: UDP-N-acetylmuramate dehydrogenase [Clostridia bacterium]|nr:UDP-N-acetylmuramate dehydrogenase [Clostridia bacterium]